MARGKTDVDEVQLETLELKISKFLRYGVILSGITMLVGWSTQLKHGDPFARFREYQSISLVESLSQYLQQQQWGMLTCYLGLGFLISLPIIRVLLTAILFLKQKEFVLAGIATFVLLALMVSFCLGIKI